MINQVLNAVAHNQARLEIPDGLIGKLIAGMSKFEVHCICRGEVIGCILKTILSIANESTCDIDSFLCFILCHVPRLLGGSS